MKKSAILGAKAGDCRDAARRSLALGGVLLAAGTAACGSSPDTEKPSGAPTFEGTYDVGETGRLRFAGTSYVLTDGTAVSTGSFKVQGERLLLTDERMRTVVWEIRDATLAASKNRASSSSRLATTRPKSELPADSNEECDASKNALICKTVELLTSIFERGAFECGSPTSIAVADPAVPTPPGSVRPANTEPEQAPPATNPLAGLSDCNPLAPLERASAGDASGTGSKGGARFKSNSTANPELDQLVAQAALYSSTPVIGIRFDGERKPPLPLQYVCSSTVVSVNGQKWIATANHCRKNSGNQMKNFRVFFNKKVDPSIVTAWAQARDTDTMYLKLDFMPQKVESFPLAPEPRKGKVTATYSGIGVNSNKNSPPDPFTWNTAYEGTLTMGGSNEYSFTVRPNNGDSGAGLIVDGKVAGVLRGNDAFRTIVSPALPSDISRLEWHAVTRD